MLSPCDLLMLCGSGVQVVWVRLPSRSTLGGRRRCLCRACAGIQYHIDLLERIQPFTPLPSVHSMCASSKVAHEVTVRRAVANVAVWYLDGI